MWYIISKGRIYDSNRDNVILVTWLVKLGKEKNVGYLSIHRSYLSSSAGFLTRGGMFLRIPILRARIHWPPEVISGTCHCFCNDPGAVGGVVGLARTGRLPAHYLLTY